MYLEVKESNHTRLTVTALEITGKRRNLEISYAETARVGSKIAGCCAPESVIAGFTAEYAVY